LNFSFAGCGNSTPVSSASQTGYFKADSTWATVSRSAAQALLEEEMGVSRPAGPKPFGRAEFISPFSEFSESGAAGHKR